MPTVYVDLATRARLRAAAKLPTDAAFHEEMRSVLGSEIYETLRNVKGDLCVVLDHGVSGAQLKKETD